MSASHPAIANSSLLRIALVLVLAPAFVALLGCPSPTPTRDATPPELRNINFHRVRAIETSDDVTQLNMGLKTEAPLLRIAAANDTIPFFPPDPYTTVGDALVLLDGPFVCRQKPGDSDYDNHPTTPDQIAGLNPEDHITYVPRISDKTDVPVCLIPYAHRQGYINSD